MDQPIGLIGGGIACDNHECDYADQPVTLENYKDYVNKPCPKCGANLLTEEDYENTKAILNLVKTVNGASKDFVFDNREEGLTTITVHVHDKNIDTQK